jgi:hypothetical protein
MLRLILRTDEWTQEFRTTDGSSRDVLANGGRPDPEISTALVPLGTYLWFMAVACSSFSAGGEQLVDLGAFWLGRGTRAGTGLGVLVLSWHSIGSLRPSHSSTGPGNATAPEASKPRPTHAWSLGGAGDHRMDLADKGPCRAGEPSALWIAASPRPELAGQPGLAGFGMQGGTPLTHQLFGHVRMRHCGLLRR